MKGLIFSIKKYSVHDGPGIRVTFFMKGCPLSCRWCHNPEGISPLQEPVVQTRKVGDKEFHVAETAGKYYDVEELLEIAGKDRIFIQKKEGGITFSGGEPLMQPEFLLEALTAFSKNGYHTVVDTSGYSSPENFRTILPFTDLFLFDIKHLDELKHIELTGVSNTGILENFRLILKSGRDIMVRIPVVPGINDDDEHLKQLRGFLSEAACFNLRKISLLPYHTIGSSKYRNLNLIYRMNDTKQPSPERMKELKEFFSATGIKVKIGG